MGQDIECANPACTCAVSPDQKHCSSHCEGAKNDTIEMVCGCGHAGCGREALEIENPVDPELE